MTPLSPDIPESFSSILAKLREAVTLVRASPVPVRVPAQGSAAEPGLARDAAHEATFDAPASTANPPLVLEEDLQACAQALRACGQAPLALMVEGCGAALQRMRTVPALHGSDAQAVVERALEAVLAHAEHPTHDALALAADLFPLYRAVQHLAGADRVHPADLWPPRPANLDLPADPFTRPRPVDAAAREAMEAALLALMRQPQAQDFQRMSELCAELGEGAAGSQADLWKLASAVYEAQADQHLSPDVYLKRLGPRLLALTRAAATPAPARTPDPARASPAAPPSSSPSASANTGPAPEPMRLLGHELLYFCHRAVAAAAAAGTRALGPRLQRFAAACGLPWGPGAEAGAEQGTEEGAQGQLQEAVQEGSAPGPSQAPTGEASLDMAAPVALVASGPALPAPRSLADAVPGLPSAADLDLSGWAVAANADQAATPDDEVKVIGPLRLEIPAFNAFLNDADETSRRLAMVLAEWAVEPSQALPVQAADQAWTLAQGADGLGHAALASLADLLARALRGMQPAHPAAGLAVPPAQESSAPPSMTPPVPLSPAPAVPRLMAAARFTAAAEEIRRVLHQFAAGFLTEPSAECLADLQECVAAAGQPVGPGQTQTADRPALAQTLPDVPARWQEALRALADLQAGVGDALDRLARCRPSVALASTGLSAEDPRASATLAEADRWFDDAWADAAAGLAACQQQIQVLQTESEPRDPSPGP